MALPPPSSLAGDRTKQEHTPSSIPWRELYSPYSPRLLSRRSLADPWLHLFREQDHGAARQRRIRPVLAGVQQRAEASYSFAKREQLIGDLVGRAPDHEVIENAVQVDGLVG